MVARVAPGPSVRVVGLVNDASSMTLPASVRVSEHDVERERRVQDESGRLRAGLRVERDLRLRVELLQIDALERHPLVGGGAVDVAVAGLDAQEAGPLGQ
jgi:hypothetical protein